MTMTLFSSSSKCKKDAKPPTRRMDRNDKALLRTSDWNSENRSDLKLEDKVSLADKNAAFLQGLVTYVGPVHFAPGTHVGIQLTGPSVGRGNCNGVVQGKKYFSDVGKNNGVLVPIDKVHRRLPKVTGDPKLDQLQQRRNSEQARMADLEFIDALTQTRALAMLKLSEERKSSGFSYSKFNKEETHITRLKQLRLVEVMRSRGIDLTEDPSNLHIQDPNLKYAPRDAPLCEPDLELAEGLEMTQQNYCLSDPTLPDNPITFASQAFLNMTGYTLNEILGRNCRFLQGQHTDEYSVYRIRLAIKEGSDCHVCLLNYRKDGTPFYNRLFMTALRDTKGRIKNYLGVQCEVSPEVARQINADEKVKLERKLYNAQLETSAHEFSESGREVSESASARGEACKSQSRCLEPRASSRRSLEPQKSGKAPRRNTGGSLMSATTTGSSSGPTDHSPPRRRSAPTLRAANSMAPEEEGPHRRTSTDSGASGNSRASGKSARSSSTSRTEPSLNSWSLDIEEELALSRGQYQ